MKKNLKKLLSIVMILTMVFAMSATAFASADMPSVKVSVTYGHFNTSGGYTGNGFTNATVPIEDYEVFKENVEFYITDSAFNLKSVYLPSTVQDPQNGKASVADAIIAAVWEIYGPTFDNGGATVIGGWDSYTTPNGGYISNIMNYPLTANATTYFEGDNGNKWGHSTGTGWNIAYKYANGSWTVPTGYATNILIEDGMEIIFDVSPYDMTWDTGVAWEE